MSTAHSTLRGRLGGGQLVWKWLIYLFSVLVANAVGFAIVWFLAYAPLDESGYITLNTRASLLDGETYGIESISVLTNRFYEIRDTTPGEPVSLVVQSCGFAFMVNGITSTTATAEEKMGRCAGVQIVKTTVSGEGFLILPVEKLFIGESPITILLTSTGPFTLHYEGLPWTPLVWIIVGMWVIVALFACGVANFFLFETFRRP